jgi:uncharacterized repeat protein (TIGR03806 family)
MRTDPIESSAADVVENLNMKIAIVLIPVVLLVLSASRQPGLEVERKANLSEYNFFKGKLSELTPEEGVLMYDVNTTLFSNYAEKLRFIKFPVGEAAVYNDTAAFDLPVGTILIKNFYYYNDFRDLSKGRRILETRLLVHQPKGWEAWPYIWKEDQSEAVYDPAGETTNITYVDAKGKKKSTLYAIPNRNQCKGCHVSDSRMKPIGITARQLNKSISSGAGPALTNQLDHWVKHGSLTGLTSLEKVPKLKVWNDPASGTVDERARAYLDANCGHCHSPKGPANTSGLFLDIFETRSSHLGVNKTPVAAGRGAGDLRFDIVPGSPDQSILVYRMKTNDPAIAMPEIGREQIHAEGVALIEEWIRSSKF